MTQKPTYTFDTDGHTVVAGDSAKKKDEINAENARMQRVQDEFYKERHIRNDRKEKELP